VEVELEAGVKTGKKVHLGAKVGAKVGAEAKVGAGIIWSKNDF
jgi:hypothetical protein